MPYTPPRIKWFAFHGESLALACIAFSDYIEEEHLKVLFDLLLAPFLVQCVFDASGSITEAFQIQEEVINFLHRPGFKLQQWTASVSHLLVPSPDPDLMYPPLKIMNASALSISFGIRSTTPCFFNQGM